jgi:hypothetical protein
VQSADWLAKCTADGVEFKCPPADLPLLNMSQCADGGELYQTMSDMDDR